jgi:hypothetical protein
MIKTLKTVNVLVPDFILLTNCYKTIKIAAILIELGINVNWTIAFVTTCQPNFSVTMATRAHLKIAKNHYFALISSIKIVFKVLQLLNELR